MTHNKPMHTLLTFTALLFASACLASDSTPGVIKEFCAVHFPTGIAARGEPFNATDVADDKPSRRIVANFVTSATAFLWYEHGGRGYHQHLVLSAHATTSSEL
jgi:hypothetical protein